MGFFRLRTVRSSKYIASHRALAASPSLVGAGYNYRRRRAPEHLDLLYVCSSLMSLLSKKTRTQHTHASCTCSASSESTLWNAGSLSQTSPCTFLLCSSHRCMKYEGSARRELLRLAPLRQRPSSSSSCGRPCPLAPSSPGRRVLLAIACHL